MPEAPTQFDVFPTIMHMQRIDPGNMRRFYLMQVQPDLFGGASLIGNGVASAQEDSTWRNGIKTKAVRSTR